MLHLHKPEAQELEPTRRSESCQRKSNHKDGPIHPTYGPFQMNFRERALGNFVLNPTAGVRASNSSPFDLYSRFTAGRLETLKLEIRVLM